MPPSFLLYFHDFIRRTIQNPAYATERNNGDVPSFFQRVQRPVINAALEQLILRHSLFRHCIPQRPIVEH